MYTTIITNIQKSFGKDSSWIIDSVIDDTFSLSKYHPLAGSNYIKLSRESDHPIKRLINIHNTGDNECFKWSIVRNLNPANYHPARIRKAGKYFDKKLVFKDIRFPVKMIGIHKIEKKNSFDITVFGCGNKEKHLTYVSKKGCEEKHVDLSLMMIYHKKK